MIGLLFPNKLQVIMIDKLSRRHIFNVSVSADKFKYKKQTYTVNPDACFEYGWRNRRSGIWNEGVSAQIDLRKGIDSYLGSSLQLSEVDKGKERELAAGAIYPFTGGYISPMTVLIVSGLITLVGVGIIWATLGPKVSDTSNHVDQIANFIGVPYAITPTAIPIE